MKLPFIILLFSAVSVFGADIPFTILDTGGYRDGGTVFCKMKSTEGETIEVCIDRRIDSDSRLEMFIGGIHPTKKSAKIAPESTRKKLVSILTELMSLEPEKYEGFMKVLEEHIKMKAEQAITANSLPAVVLG